MKIKVRQAKLGIVQPDEMSADIQALGANKLTQAGSGRTQTGDDQAR